MVVALGARGRGEGFPIRRVELLSQPGSCGLDGRESFWPLRLAGGSRPEVFCQFVVLKFPLLVSASASSLWTFRTVFGAFATKLSRKSGDISAHWAGIMLSV